MLVPEPGLSDLHPTFVMTMPYAFLIEKYLFMDMFMNKRVFSF